MEGQLHLGVYRHYKGNYYEVIGFAKHSETLEDMVIYKALYGEGGTWVRPLSMWGNLIEVEGRTVKRFEMVKGKSARAGQRRPAQQALPYAGRCTYEASGDD